MVNWAGVQKLVAMAPPVQIFHPIFQEFLNRVRDPGFKPDAEVVGHISDLIHRSSPVYPTQCDAQRTAATPHKSAGVLCGTGHTRQVSYSGPSHFQTNCGLQSSSYSPEHKREICEGECDPFLQAAYALQDFPLVPEVRVFHTLFFGFLTVLN